MDGNFLVTVMDVHQENLQEVWPALVVTIKNSSFIGVDCELSGLGPRNLINSRDVDDRYGHIAEVARTRSIISMGLSCFKAEGFSDRGDLRCDVRTYNLTALCAEEFVVEPGALKFLVDHGFDFHKQYSRGIPYHRGNDKDPSPKTKKKWDLRDLFGVLVSSGVPLVLHNGMVDLIFLYQSFYAELPTSLQTFVADLEQMFPGGLYDSKYIAEFDLRTSASFLEFVFRKEQIRNLKARAGKTVILNHVLRASQYVDVWDCSPHVQSDQEKPICPSYTNHGHCSEGQNCDKSHDVVRAVLQEREKKQKSRKRKLEQNGESPLGPSEAPPVLPPPPTERFRGHRAGHDAFMTGFCFASFLAGRSTANLPADIPQWIRDATRAVRNRICLTGKDFPLLIQRSSFSKCSKAHTDKHRTLRETADSPA